MREFITEQEWLDFALKNIAGKRIHNVSSGSGYLGNSLEKLIHGKKLSSTDVDLVIEGEDWEMKTFRGNKTISCSKTKINPDDDTKNSFEKHLDYTCKKMRNLILFKFHEAYSLNEKTGIELISVCNEIFMRKELVEPVFKFHLSTRASRNNTVWESNINVDKLLNCYTKGRSTPPISNDEYKVLPDFPSPFGMSMFR